MSYYIGLSILSNNHGYNDNQHRGAGLQKLLSAEARRILSRLEDRPLTENDIAREARGRPFFPDSDTDFSIAHSGTLAVVSLIKGKNLRTACDVELVRPRSGAREIAEEFFTALERNYVLHRGQFDLSRFYMIWALKECFIKLRGLSVFDMAGLPSFIYGEGFCTGHFAFDSAVSSPLSFGLYELSGGAGERYMLAAALEGTEDRQPEMRWFSQSFPACKSIAKIKAAPSPAETVRPKI
jgi:hypothetical protein